MLRYSEASGILRKTRQDPSEYLRMTSQRISILLEALSKKALFPLVILAFVAPLAHAVEHTKGQGEPYALAGKRLVFTNWIFVRTGQLDWVDDKGASIYGKDVKSGPTDAHFRQLMAPRGVRLTSDPAQRSDQPFIARDRPWEAMGIGVGTLLRDEGKYRLWGFCQDADGVCRMCYFESSDGLKWDKPNLGVMDFNGSKDNNLV